jgi:hypothetical protein
VRQLLSELSEDRAPHGPELTRTVVRTARWQRPVRRVLIAASASAGAVGAGVSATFRAYRRR